MINYLTKYHMILWKISRPGMTPPLSLQKKEFKVPKPISGFKDDGKLNGL